MQGKWLELWNIKTGRTESEDLSDNIAVQLGILTEPFNLSWFEKRNDCALEHHQREYRKAIGKVPAQGTIDAMWDSRIVEAKHTHAFNSMDTLIEYYMPQIQLYAHLAGAEGIHLSVIFGNNKWEDAYVRYDDEYFNSMWAVVSDFWNYVLRDQQPIAVTVPQISIEAIEVDDMVIRNATQDNAFVDAAHTYIENEAASRSFDTAKKDLKAMVADNEREVYCGTLSIKRSKNGALRFTKLEK